jgi:hypothetical protein
VTVVPSSHPLPLIISELLSNSRRAVPTLDISDPENRREQRQSLTFSGYMYHSRGMT